MTKISVRVDEELLAAAQRVLGTTTKRDTINAALARVVADAERAQAVQKEIERGRSGFYDRLRESETRDQAAGGLR